MTRASCWPVAAALLLAGCGSASRREEANARPDQSRQASSFKAVQAIFTANCVSCHNGAQQLGGLNLEEGHAILSLVGVRSQESALARVAPGVPDKSYLYLKLAGRQFEGGGQGERMPLDNAPLPQRSMALIRTWIAAGAPPPPQP